MRAAPRRRRRFVAMMPGISSAPECDLGKREGAKFRPHPINPGPPVRP